MARADDKSTDLVAAASLFAAAAGTAFLVPYYHLNYACLAAVPALGWAGYMYLESYERRNHGSKLEIRTARLMTEIMPRFGFNVQADVKINHGNIDFIAERDGQRNIIEIKPWWKWSRDHSCMEAINQVIAQTREIAGRPVIYLPASKRNFRLMDGPVMVVGGSVKYLAGNLLIN